jgi:hypothetical protein
LLLVLDSSLVVTMSASRIEYSEKYADDANEYRYGAVLGGGTAVEGRIRARGRTSRGADAGLVVRGPLVASVKVSFIHSQAMFFFPYNCSFCRSFECYFESVT